MDSIPRGNNKALFILSFIRRIEGLKKRRERREEMQAQRDKEAQDTVSRREVGLLTRTNIKYH